MRSSGDLLRVAVGSPDEPNPREPRKVALAPVTRERAVGPAFPSTPIRHRCSVRSPGSGACAACQRPGSAVRQGGLPAGGACAPGRPAVPCASKARSVASLSLCPQPRPLLRSPSQLLLSLRHPRPLLAPCSHVPSTRSHWGPPRRPRMLLPSRDPPSPPQCLLSHVREQTHSFRGSGDGAVLMGGGVFYLPRWAGPPGRPLSLGCTSSTLIH